MEALSRGAIERIARRHFGDLGEEAVATAVAIALAESGGDPSAVNDNYPRWQAADSPYRWDRGLMQINSIHGVVRQIEQIENPVCLDRQIDAAPARPVVNQLNPLLLRRFLQVDHVVSAKRLCHVQAVLVNIRCNNISRITCFKYHNCQ